MRILTAESMAAVDRRAMEEIGIPGPVLMENAALGLADGLGQLFPEVEAVAIVCGPGNNGGDGFALARHLDARGYRVELIAAFAGKEPSEDCALQARICEAQGISRTDLEEEADLPEATAMASQADLVVDALFGTGLGRPLEGFFADLVTGLNGLPVPILAVDLPSGLSGSRSGVPGPHIQADATVTFAAPKLAHIFPPAEQAVGELLVSDLGIPPSLVDEAPEEGGALHLLTAAGLAPALPRRQPEGHKGTHGHVLVVAGAPGTAGAAVLCARAAVRAGAGLVTVAVPGAIASAVDIASLESITRTLPAAPGGGLDEEAVAAIHAATEGKDVVALGPGLGGGGPLGEELAQTLRKVVLGCPLPLVLDADGLNAFAGHLEELAERPAATVLTPHPGELARLLGCSSAEVQEDRLAAVRRAARQSRAVVVLKGQRSLIAVPGDGDSAVWVCLAGNPGLGTGGTGDVLTGVLAGIWAQILAGTGSENPPTGLDAAADAARLAVWLHGEAGDQIAAERGERSLAAGDLESGLPAAFRVLETA